MKELAHWRGVGLLDEARKEMEGVFNRFFGPASNGDRAAKYVWSPRVDMTETDKAIELLADLPGVDPKDVDITLEDGVLTVKGEKKEEHEEKDKSFHKTERFVGSFYRQIVLPSSADESKVSASSANGTIKIHIPKKPSAQPKKVTIKPNA